MADRVADGKIEHGSFFENARARAFEYLRNPGKLNRLLDRATREIYRRQEAFAGLRDSLQTCLRLLRAYANGRYRGIPAASLVSIVAWLIYFVMPVDSIPDFILALGLVDDAALLGWVLSSVRTDLDRFVEWENRVAGEPAKSALGKN